MSGFSCEALLLAPALAGVAAGATCAELRPRRLAVTPGEDLEFLFR